MKGLIRKYIIERWWIWVFLIFIVFIFQLGDKKSEEVLQNSPRETITETTNVHHEQDVQIEEKVDLSEFKRVRTEEELNETIASIPNSDKVIKTDKTNEKEEDVSATNENKRTEQEKQLQLKWDLKNGMILSETLTLDVFTKGITTYYLNKQQPISEITPILHETSATVYYEYPLKEEQIIQATALSEGNIIKSITVQVKNLANTKEVLDLITTIVSPEMSEEERNSLNQKLEEGSIHKYQTKKNIVYQWSISGENGLLTVMKEKE